MKRMMMSLTCMTLGLSVGCCCSHGQCGGGACGGACGTPGGWGPGAYATGSSISAGVPATNTYAYGPVYPTTAALPINSLPTY
jgi:hypothetical protein